MAIQADLGTQKSLEGQDIISEGKIVTRSLGADILGRFNRQTTSVSTEKKWQVLCFKFGLKNRTGIPSKELKNSAYSLVPTAVVLYFIIWRIIWRAY